MNTAGNTYSDSKMKVIHSFFITFYLLISDKQIIDLYRYFKDLIVIGCNISITSLLWAGAFANKKNCLPIYALLEVLVLYEWKIRCNLFVQTIFLIISSVRFVVYLVESGEIEGEILSLTFLFQTVSDSNSDRFVVASVLFGLFFFYLFIVCPRVSIHEFMI